MRKLTSQDFSIVYWRKNCAIINFLCYFVALFAWCLLQNILQPFWLLPSTRRCRHFYFVLLYFAAVGWPRFLVLFLLPLAATFLIFCNICHVFLAFLFACCVLSQDGAQVRKLQLSFPLFPCPSNVSPPYRIPKEP